MKCWVWIWAALTLPLDVCAASPNGTFLVIGIKSSVLRGRVNRQAIRATWAAPELTTPLGVHVLFLGGEPDLSVLEHTHRHEEMRLVESEKSTYGDLLTHELGCQDSFFSLVDKTAAFIKYTADRFPTAAYVMLIDDDAYVRIDQIVLTLQSPEVPSERFYGGSIAPRTVKPIRNQSSRYFLDPGAYPLSEFFPYANGASYIISNDIMRFIARNSRQLQGLRGLDDVTMALWIRAMVNIQPQDMPQIRIMRLTNCTNDIAVYADLSPQALRSIHNNLVSARSFCDGFDLEAWGKEYQTIHFPVLEAEDISMTPVGASGGNEGDIRFQWDVQIQPCTGVMEIETTVQVKNERVVATYVPSSGMYATIFCNHIIMLLQMRLNIVVGTRFCKFHSIILAAYLQSLPRLRHVVHHALHNLERYSQDQHNSSDPFVVRYVGMDERPFHALRLAVNCLILQWTEMKPLVWANQDTGKADLVVFPTCIAGDHSAAKSDKGAVAILCISDRFSGTSEHGGSTVHRPDTLSSSPEVAMYLPSAAFIFGEIFAAAPSMLLEPYPMVRNNSLRTFCAHGFHRGGIEHQQRMLVLLELVGPVESVPHKRFDARLKVGTTLDEIINTLKAFKFVLAFEDDEGVPGLISETMSLAFLAGAVPIYLGHSASVSWLFNPRAYIDCGTFEHLEDCVERIIEVHQTSVLFEAMRSEAPIVNRSAFEQVFAWYSSANTVPE